MIVEKLADELKTAFRLSNGDSGMAWLAVARRAKELLGDKPVATREAIMSRLDDMPNRTTWNANTVTQIMDALAHFAPPRQRMMLDGATVAQIKGEYLAHDPTAPAWMAQKIADFVYRLANTPVPQADVDLERGREILNAANDTLPEGAPRLAYKDEYARAVGRAVAAMEKGDE